MKRTALKRKTPLKAKRAISSKKQRDRQSIAKAKKTPSGGNFAPKKRRKKTDLAKAKAKLWKLCKQIIFQRHGNDCYTCPSKNLQGSNCQLGHFISSSICSTELRYDLRNLRIQCFSCNIHKSGNWVEYEKHLKADGVDVEYLKRRNEETKGEQYRLDWYEEKIEHYEALL